MADKANRNKDNVPGKYYVDDQCVGCGVCEGEAPAVFKMKDGDNYAYVHKQPSSPDDESAAEIAMNACPVSAIGNDGA